MLKWLFIALGLLLVVIVVGGLIDERLNPPEQQVAVASPGLKVTKAAYGDKWPFTVDEGFVGCVEPSSAVFRHGGITYQLNGIAKDKGFPDIRPIWRGNPAIPGTKINIGDMIKLALEQCY